MPVRCSYSIANQKILFSTQIPWMKLKIISETGLGESQYGVWSIVQGPLKEGITISLNALEDRGMI